MGTARHRMDDHRVIAVDAQHADLKQVAAASRADAQREVVIQSPLRDGVADGVKRILVSDCVLASRLRDPHDDKIPCHAVLSRNLVAGRRGGGTRRNLRDTPRGSPRQSEALEADALQRALERHSTVAKPTATSAYTI